MEVIGFGIGAAPLLFQIFAGCIKAYQLLSEARGLDRDHRFFRILFKTEQYRLLDWASIVGLGENDETLDINMTSRPVLLDILDQQYRLMLRFGRLDDRLRPLSRPLLSEEAGPEHYISSAPSDDDGDTLPHRFPNTNALLEKSLDFIKRTGKFPAKLKWVVSDKPKIENLIAKLTSLNDYLDHLLSNKQIKSLISQQTRTNYQIMQLNNKMDDLCELFKACNSTIPPSSLPPGEAPGWHTSRDLAVHNEPGLASLAQFKALRFAIESKTLNENFKSQLGLKSSLLEGAPLSLSRQDLQLFEEKIKEPSKRIPAWYKPPDASWRRVWVEWNSSISTPNLGREAIGQTPTLDRFEALVRLLRQDEVTKQFRTMKCLGYYTDEETVGDRRYGFVFENPDGVDPTIEPTSLISLISNKPMPSLTARIKLMKVLAECLERLHAVDWLHKGLRSQNIIFFPEEEDVDFSRPYLSGFDYSRPEGASFMSENPSGCGAEDFYRHPSVQGGPEDGMNGLGFKKQHDIYSLGVVFLEIIYWKPIHVILEFSSAQEVRPRDIVGVRSKLLQGEYAAYVRSFVGDSAADIIITCLKGPTSFRRAQNTLGSNIESANVSSSQNVFFEDIVKKLQKMRI